MLPGRSPWRTPDRRTLTEPCPVCGRYPNRPATADAVVVRDGQLLLIQRSSPPFEGYFALPGGFVDQGESTADCAVRELAEETGLTGMVDRMVGVYDAPDRDPWRHTITFAYLITVPDGIEPVAADDAAHVVWAPVSDLPPLAFDHGAIVKDALSSL